MYSIASFRYTGNGCNALVRAGGTSYDAGIGKQGGRQTDGRCRASSRTELQCGCHEAGWPIDT